MLLVTALAVISTTVAVIEGVMLSHRPAAAPLAVVAQAPADSDLAALPAPVPVQKTAKPVTEPLAPPQPQKDPAILAPLPPDRPDLAAAPAPTATPATSAASAEPALTEEEQAAREKSLAAAKFKDSLSAQMDQAVKQMIDELKLRDDQKLQAAPTIEKIRQAMTQMVTGPMNAGNDMKQKLAAIRQNGLAAHLSPDQIDAQVTEAQANLKTQIQDQVVGGMTTLSTTLDELRPILDVTQSAALDQMQKELQQQQAMMKKMMSAMTQPDAPAAP